MFDFFSSDDVVLGIDIGSASIKAVELRVVDGKPVLTNYAWMPIKEELLGKSDANPDMYYSALTACIKRIMKSASFSSKNAYVSIPAFGGLITIVDLPEMPENEIDKAIRFEAHKYIPTAIDELVVSWEVVGRKIVRKENVAAGSGEGEKMANNMLEVLLVVGSKERVLKYEKMFTDAQLKLMSVDIETFPLVRALVGNDDGTFILADIGAYDCNIALVEKKVIRASRNIDAGGNEITETIAKSMNIDFERAESLKVSERNFFSEDASMNFFTLDMIINEIGRIIESYRKKQGPDKNIDGIIVSGGTANMTGIANYFQSRLQIKTMIGNPFNRLSYDKKLETSLSRISNRFSVSIGLALKGIDGYLAQKKK